MPTKDKIEAQYRDQPKGQQQCSKCSMYRTPKRCTLVKGIIQPHGWCKFFDWKELVA